jgi:hypothetical protein
MIAAQRCVRALGEREEAGAAPGGAGDYAGDGGEALIGGALPLEALCV